MPFLCFFEPFLHFWQILNILKGKNMNFQGSMPKNREKIATKWPRNLKGRGYPDPFNPWCSTSPPIFFTLCLLKKIYCTVIFWLFFEKNKFLRIKCLIFWDKPAKKTNFLNFSKFHFNFLKKQSKVYILHAKTKFEYWKCQFFAAKRINFIKNM